MPTPGAKSNKSTIAGFFQILVGCILFVFFGIGAAVSRFWYYFADASGALPLVLFLIGTAGGVFFFWKGINKINLAHRFRKISRIMGEDTAIQLSVLEKKLNWKRNQAVKALQRQIAQGFWTDAYLDTDSGVFMIGYDPPVLLTDSGNQAVDELLNTANGFIHEMVAINHTVSDPGLKARIVHLTDIAGQIYTFIKKNPGKIHLVRQFSNYYLPVTVDLLKNYQELQGQAIKGENIRESMLMIADGMGTVETAFKKQLNDLYQDKSLDISVDVEVLQKMINDT